MCHWCSQGPLAKIFYPCSESGHGSSKPSHPFHPNSEMIQVWHGAVLTWSMQMSFFLDLPIDIIFPFGTWDRGWGNKAETRAKYLDNIPQSWTTGKMQLDLKPQHFSIKCLKVWHAIPVHNVLVCIDQFFSIIPEILVAVVLPYQITRAQPSLPVIDLWSQG